VNRQPRGSHGSGLSITNPGKSQASAPRRPRTHPPYTRSARIAVAHMHVIGTGVIPACRDTNHSTDQDRPVPVARIDGVDPGLAVATYPDGAVYVNALTSGVINKVLKSARGIRWR